MVLEKQDSLIKTSFLLRQLKTFRVLPALVSIAFLSIAITACQEDKKNYVYENGNANEVPSMVTRNVETFISDSGITRYHISTKTWNVFDEAREPRWTFPDGLFLEQYDDSFNQSAKVVCDSAIYFSEKRIWRLDGNVVMINVEKDTFMTKQLFWDQRRKRIYSDTAFMRIVSRERTIEGYGFSSNEQMNDYYIKRPTAIFPAENMRKNNDTTNIDSTVKAQPQPSIQTQQKPNGLKKANINPQAIND